MRNLPIPRQTERQATMAANPGGQPEPVWRDSGTSVDVVAYLKVLRKRKWMILIPLLVVLPLSALFLLSAHPSYEATAILLIEPANPQVVNIEEVQTPDRSREYYKSQYALIKSEGLLGRVVDTLSGGAPAVVEAPEPGSLAARIDELKARAKAGVQKLREMVSGPSPTLSFDPQEVARRERIGRLQRAMRVEPVGMRLVHVTIAHPDPRRATAQVNTLAETYVAQNLETKLAASEQASTWLEEKVQELRAELQQSEAALQAFIAEHKLVPAGLDDKPLVAVEEYKNLTAAYAAYKADQVALQARRRELAQMRKQPFEKLVASVSSQMDNPLVDVLRQRYAELQVEHGVLLENFRPKHPKLLAVETKMRTVQTRISAEIDKYADRLKSEYALASQKVRMFGGRINNKKGEIIESNEDLEAYALTVRPFLRRFSRNHLQTHIDLCREA